jgi:tetratricopeptide (TPR) repeat protein
MPETSFARMRRHDHSMLPPSPAATLKFRSPNACNLCHQNRSAEWADAWVRKWYPRDYQAPLLHRGVLIEAARRETWTKLRDMVAYVMNPGRNEVFAASLLRLMARCPLPEKWPAFQAGLKDQSPLVRSSAVAGIGESSEPWVTESLLEAAGDEYRVVRTEAAAVLARQRLDSLQPEARNRDGRAQEEYLESLRSQPDDPRRHYNLGNYYQGLGDLQAAKSAYQVALRLQPSYLPAWINLSIVNARAGDSGQAEQALREALKLNPASAEANFNLGLLLAETGKMEEAENRLRSALKSAPDMAEAACNLAMLLGKARPREALPLFRRAVELRPRSFKFGYALAFFLRESGDSSGAVDVLRPLVERHPDQADGILLLGSILEGTGRRKEALNLYRRAVSNPDLADDAHRHFATLAAALSNR